MVQLKKIDNVPSLVDVVIRRIRAALKRAIYAAPKQGGWFAVTEGMDGMYRVDHLHPEMLAQIEETLLKAGWNKMNF